MGANVRTKEFTHTYGNVHQLVSWSSASLLMCLGGGETTDDGWVLQRIQQGVPKDNWLHPRNVDNTGKLTARVLVRV